MNVCTYCQVSLSLNNLAALLRKMEMYTDAEELYRKALVMREDALGQVNPQVEFALSNNSNNSLSTLVDHTESASSLQILSVLSSCLLP